MTASTARTGRSTAAGSAFEHGKTLYGAGKSARREQVYPYLIRKNCRDALNIRKGPSTNYGILGQIKDTLRYTIVEERSGPGSDKGWGRLKAGGWVALDWVKKA